LVPSRHEAATRKASGSRIVGRRARRAKTLIVEEVEHVRWRIWNGKAKNVRLSINRIRKVMHVFKGERGHRTTGTSSGKLWSALHEVDGSSIMPSDIVSAPRLPEVPRTSLSIDE
jgi:hypothetical protein